MLVDIYYLLVAQTGVRTYTEELVNQILLSKRPHHDYLILPDYKKTINNNYFRGRTSRFRNLYFQFHYLFWKQVRLPFLAFINRVDVILSPDYLSPWYKTSALKIPVIHDAFFWEDPQNYNRWWLTYFRKSILLGLRGRSLVLTISHYAKARIKQFLPIEQSYEIAYQGSKFLASNAYDDAFLEKYNLQPGHFFLFLGVLEKRKNLLTLIRAFDLFLKTNPNAGIKLVLAGQRGPRISLDDYPAIVELISRLKLTNKIILTGYVSIEEATTLYSSALSFVFPSSNEGFGLPVVEAFSKRLPVIVSSNGALVEIGGDAVLSFDTFNPVDLCGKLDAVFKDEDLRRDMIGRGLKRLSKFSWEKFFVSLEEIISKHTSKEK